MKTIAQEIAELRRMNVPGLLERYRELYGKDPRIKHRDWLWKKCAWRLQEQRLGGLSAVAKRRLEELIAEIDVPLAEKQRTVSGALRGPRRPGDPVVGTTLTRDWKGHEVRVSVVDSGYEHDGVLYRSLSAVAKAITGAHWNGRLFFGLTKRKGAK